MSRWFRYYDEALDDPKVQRLDGDTFKAWINLLCLASRNGGIFPPMEDIAFALRIDGNAARTLIERLLNATLIDSLNGGANGKRYAPHGWQERQYKSDTSTDRVKRFRQRSKTVTETAPDTETETEKKTEPKGSSKCRVERTKAVASCLQIAFSVPDDIPIEAWEAWIEMRKRLRKSPTNHAKTLAIAELRRLRDEEGWPPGDVLNHCTMNSYQGIYPPKKRDRYERTDRDPTTVAVERFLGNVGTNARTG